MVEYITLFFVLLIASIAFYMGYDRFFRREQKSDTALYVEALRDLLDGRPESAFTKLRQVVASDSNNLDAYLRLGQILREYKKPDRAVQVHKDLTVRSGLSEDEKANILNQLALDYIAMDQPDTAEAALKEMSSLKPNSHWALARLLQLQQESGKWQEAYETANKLLKLESNKSKKPLAYLKYRMGKELWDKRECHKARILFKEAIGLNPQFAAAYLAIGDSYRDEKRLEDAVNFWRKLIEAVPEEGYRVIERLKKALFDLGRFGDIVGICENILSHSPKDLTARRTLAEFHKKKGEFNRAEELLGQIVDEHPEEMGAVIELIQIYLEQNKSEKIQVLLRELGTKVQKDEKPSGDGIVDTSLIGIN